MKTFIFIASVLFSLQSFADDLAQQRCDSLARFANSIMKARQSNVPIRELLDIANTSQDYRLLQAVVIEAYDYPVYTFYDNRIQVIKDFEQRVYARCIRVFN